jgi:hypothetical protein
LALDPFTERHHQIVALEAREANVEDVGRINCADLVCWAMRMRASRVIVGEVLVTRVAAALNPAAETSVNLVARASNDAAAAADGLATCPDAARLRWLRPECQPRRAETVTSAAIAAATRSQHLKISRASSCADRAAVPGEGRV